MTMESNKAVPAWIRTGHEEAEPLVGFGKPASSSRLNAVHRDMMERLDELFYRQDQVEKDMREFRATRHLESVLLHNYIQQGKDVLSFSFPETNPLVWNSTFRYFTVPLVNEPVSRLVYRHPVTHELLPGDVNTVEVHQRHPEDDMDIIMSSDPTLCLTGNLENHHFVVREQQERQGFDRMDLEYVFTISPSISSATWVNRITMYPFPACHLLEAKVLYKDREEDLPVQRGLLLAPWQLIAHMEDVQGFRIRVRAHDWVPVDNRFRQVLGMRHFNAEGAAFRSGEYSCTFTYSLPPGHKTIRSITPRLTNPHITNTSARVRLQASLLQGEDVELSPVVTPATGYGETLQIQATLEACNSRLEAPQLEGIDIDYIIHDEAN